MSRAKFLIFMVIGVPWFYISPEIRIQIDPLEMNGFIKFFLKFLASAPPVLLVCYSVLSLWFSLGYFVVRPDPEMKKLAGNLFSFFIWKEFKDE